MDQQRTPRPTHVITIPDGQHLIDAVLTLIREEIHKQQRT